MIVGLVHYLADLPRCWGECHHGQGRVPCTSPNLCAGANAAMADAARECRRQLRAEPELMGDRMGMACAETTTQPADLAPLRTWPYAEHSRPGKLTEAEIMRHNAEKNAPPLGALLLRTGAVTWHRSGKPAPTRLQRIKGAAADMLANVRTAWLSFRIRRLGRL